MEDINGKEIKEGDKYKDSWNRISTVKRIETDQRVTTGHGQSEREIFIGLKLENVPEMLEIIK